MLVLAPPATRLAPMAWTSEWRVLYNGKSIGTARETWQLAADGSGTTRFLQTLDGPGREGRRTADRRVILSPGGVPTHEELTVSAPAGRGRYVAEFKPKLATLRNVGPGIRATYEVDAPAGVSRGTLTPPVVARLAKSGGSLDIAVFEPQRTRWSRIRATLGKRFGADTLVRLQDDLGARSDYAFDAKFRPRTIQFSTGYRFVRASVREGA